MVKNLTVSEKQEKHRSQLIAQSFSGPLPPPALLNQYDVVTRKVIVGMAYKQSSHRQFLEKSVITSNISNEKTGMWIAAFITCFMIGGGIYLLMNDKGVVGFFLIFGTSIFQAGNYIYNKRKEQEVQKNKNGSDKKTG